MPSFSHSNRMLKMSTQAAVAGFYCPAICIYKHLFTTKCGHGFDRYRHIGFQYLPRSGNTKVWYFGRLMKFISHTMTYQIFNYTQAVATQAPRPATTMKQQGEDDAKACRSDIAQ